MDEIFFCLTMVMNNMMSRMSNERIVINKDIISFYDISNHFVLKSMFSPRSLVTFSVMDEIYWSFISG